MTLPRSTIRFAYRQSPHGTADFCRLLAEQPLSDPLAVASPDIGDQTGAVFREHLEKRLGRAVEFLFMESVGRGQVSGQQIVGSRRGRHVLLIDDLCVTARPF